MKTSPGLWLAVLGAALGLVLPCSISSRQAAKGLDTVLPEGEGKALVVAACMQCHNAKTITTQQKDAASWKGTVHDMISKGAQLFPEEVDGVVSYLTKHFGPKETQSKQNQEKPAGRGSLQEKKRKTKKPS